MNDKELLGKADGLMRRAAPAPVGTDTASVPILTDFVDPPPDAQEPAVPAAASSQHDEITARVTRHVEQRLEEEMQRVRRELAQAVAEAVREALGRDPPVK